MPLALILLAVVLGGCAAPEPAPNRATETPATIEPATPTEIPATLTPLPPRPTATPLPAAAPTTVPVPTFPAPPPTIDPAVVAALILAQMATHARPRPTTTPNSYPRPIPRSLVFHWPGRAGATTAPSRLLLCRLWARGRGRQQVGCKWREFRYPRRPGRQSRQASGVHGPPMGRTWRVSPDDYRPVCPFAVTLSPMVQRRDS